MSMIGSMIARDGKSVTIQRPTVTSISTYTGDTTSWSAGTTTLAVITMASGADMAKAQKMGIEVTHKMYIEYMDILEKDRVLYNSNYYFITLVENPQQRNEFLQVLLKGGDNYNVNSK